MKILFVHQNFPVRFPHLAPAHGSGALRATILDGHDPHRRSLPRQMEWVESRAPMG